MRQRKSFRFFSSNGRYATLIITLFIGILSACTKQSTTQTLKTFTSPELGKHVGNELSVKTGETWFAGEDYRNFKLTGEALTSPDAEASLRFHTDGQSGYEITFRNGAIDGTRKTGSLAAVRNLYRSLAEDGKWFRFEVAVRGKNITVAINDTTVEGNVYNGSINCWHWIPAFTEMDCTGPNSYGVLEGWMAYTISGAAGWFGIGIEASTSDTIVGVGRDNKSLKLDASAIAELKAKASAALQAVGSMDESYSLHLSLMSQRAGVYCFKLYDGIIDGCPVTIGASEGEGDFWFPRDGEWHEIEVPMSFFINKGLNLANIKSLSACNLIALTQPETGTWPTDLNLDAVFFYQPAK